MKKYVSDQENKDKVLNILDEGKFRTRDLIKVEDSRIIFDNERMLWERILDTTGGLIMFIVFTYLILISFNKKLPLSDMIGVFFSIPASIFGFILVVNNILNTERKFVFDRLAGTVTMRATVLNWRPRTVTIPFEKARIGITGTPMNSIVGIRLPNSRFSYLKITALNDLSERLTFLSYITWYMDKNRPLPTGEEFDPYRKSDFERRKAEGFPKPLYRSRIDMVDYDGCTCRYKADY